MARLEQIVRQVENNEEGIDLLAARLKEAQELIAFCRKKLFTTDEEVKKILAEGENE